MTRYLRLIWFFEGKWTKYHAAIGINAQKTLCGIWRSTRAILPSEKINPYIGFGDEGFCCLKCVVALIKRYGAEDVVKVKVG